jgi:hypothetical protein
VLGLKESILFEHFNAKTNTHHLISSAASSSKDQARQIKLHLFDPRLMRDELKLLADYDKSYSDLITSPVNADYNFAIYRDEEALKSIIS